MNLKVLLRSVFDFDFSKTWTPSFIPLIYGGIIAVASLIYTFQIFAAFSVSILGGIFTLIYTPLLFLITVVSARMMLEVVLAIFRIAESTATLRGAAGQRTGPPPMSPPPAA